jgi:hypothetical protein
MNYTLGDHWNEGPKVVGTGSTIGDSYTIGDFPKLSHHKCPHPGCPVPDYDDEKRVSVF